ncbi:protealysin inhibitor emfourin [Cryobacterium psychrophilum]|uniref:Uncharacterized protein n=1 Tax=Cryobacterium psychrophilum TaxID=41988 RepID=A0A4Y8KJQ6_9MICO|nr:protealysin inhibitor emfourin [Cryobacterium psychrophilum]TDW29985.1 hypothetical protein EDD25_1714 [Cryobacterium psychrophilum]TFD75563.1 hypothetical protein E3T53_15885 [Cryobacterium psychrophilum]
MKLCVRRGGGFAGMVARTDLDSAVLPPADATTLAAEIDRAGLRNLTEPRANRTWPDAQLYDISLVDGKREYHYRCTDATIPEGVRELLAWVDERPERVESIES